MKICWDNLEEFKYNKKKYTLRRKNKTYYFKVCKNCGEEYFGYKNSKFCNKNCSNKGENNPFFNKHHTEKHKIKMHNNMKGDKCHFWKGGYHSKGIPLYDTYAPQLEWCEEVRRSPTDKNILEVRCVKCNEWFIPTLINVDHRIQHLKNNRLSENKFYCSDNCKNSCSIYGKKPETLMKEDAIRAGRLDWLELNREVQPELRKMVLERDKYQCVKCGSKGPLHCHHIYPVSINPIESADVDNCITYCVDCHKEAHQKDGCKIKDLMEKCI